MLQKYPYALLKYRRAYTNFFKIAFEAFRGRFPIEAKLRNGESIVLKTEREAWYQMLYANKLLDGSEFSLRFDMLKDEAQIMSKDGEQLAVIKNFINNGDLWGVFIKGEYNFLNVKGKTVIDIGCNIADSAIYFVLKGAKKVIALEPFPSNYEMALKNIQSNGFSPRIEILLSGCGDRKKIIKVKSGETGNSMSKLEESTSGKNIQILSLESILTEFSIEQEVILKMDCEGCEYESIIECPDQILKKFSQFAIEYHNGYDNLRRKLERNGFEVKVSRPTRWKQRNSGKILYTGMLHAYQAAKT